MARFARCNGAGDPFVYMLDAQSIQRAASQGITTQHIQAFISRQLDGKPLPLPIVKLLRNWQDGAKTSVTFESLVVLRTTSEETLEKIFAIPALRRYLGARLDRRPASSAKINGRRCSQFWASMLSRSISRACKLTKIDDVQCLSRARCLAGKRRSWSSRRIWLLSAPPLKAYRQQPAALSMLIALALQSIGHLLRLNRRSLK